jgi:hypothetical protein
VAYIGRPSIVGNFVKLDAITAVNGQAAYTMQNNSVNFTDYSTVNQFLVSLNSVIQSPGSSFTVSGSTLTFASNLSTGDVIDFIIVFGNSLSAGVPTDDTVSTAKLADNAVTAAKITDSTITAAKLASGVVQNQSAFKNIIINGDMSVAQRGTSQASITSSEYYTIDRIRTAINNGGTWTQSQSTEVPTGQGFATSIKMDCTTADTSLSSGDFLHLQFPIEAQYLQYLKYGTSSAETLTLSFWVRSNKTGTYCICLQKSDNTRYDFVAEYSISSADTWEKKTITIAPDSNIQAAGGAIDNDNGEGFKLKFTLLSSGRTGTNNTWNSSTPADCTSNQVNLADSTSNEWYITGVQLEVGTSATDFEFLPFDVNQQRCQRYYFKTGGTSATAVGNASKNFMNVLVHAGTDARGQFFRPTMMRASPTFAANGSFQILGQINQTISSASDITLADGGGVSLNMSALTCELPSGSTAGHNGVCRANGDADAFFEFISEL